MENKELSIKEIARKLQNKISSTYGLALPNLDKLIEDSIINN